jgi:CO dehydrogenase maturation factor
MKVMICGKGGSGKSTVTVLLAKALAKNGKTPLVVDADESNLCLHRLLGADLPANLLDDMGGRAGVKARRQNPLMAGSPELFAADTRVSEIPARCLAEADGVKLLLTGKIQAYGEGCACMIGSISRSVVTHLREAEDEVVLVDAEAGLEHFGRRIDAGCDLVLHVVDPTHESVAMAERVREMADGGRRSFACVLNKMDAVTKDLVLSRLDGYPVIAAIPLSDSVFQAALGGESLTVNLPEVDDICRYLEDGDRSG